MGKGVLVNCRGTSCFDISVSAEVDAADMPLPTPALWFGNEPQWFLQWLCPNTLLRARTQLGVLLMWPPLIARLWRIIERCPLFAFPAGSPGWSARSQILLPRFTNVRGHLCPTRSSFSVHLFLVTTRKLLNCSRRITGVFSAKS